MGAIDYRRASASVRPPPRLAVWEWADEKRELSQAESAEPGPWRTDRVPYMREIMEVMSAYHPAREVVFQKGAQVAGTEAILNALGAIMDITPGPTMVVMPSDGTAADWSRDRLGAMIRSTPCLDALFGSGSRNPNNTTKRKKFPGGYIKIAHATSAKELRSRPIRFLFLDEIDGYPIDVDGEGDPVELAGRRTATYGSTKKVVKISTPTFESTSRIEPAYLASDQRKYFVPCLECGHYQVLKFEQLKWPKGEPGKARYECCECSALHEEHDKTEMLERGEWRARNDDVPEGRVGFHLSALYSPAGWFSWGQAATKFYEATKEKSKPKLRTFKNTVLAQTWRDTGETPDWEKLYLRSRGGHEIGTVPEDGLVLTAGVDVQGDRLEMEVVAWGKKMRSWSVDYAVITGDTSGDEVWDELEERIHRAYPHASGGKLKISRVAIDSGYRSQSVYRFCRREPLAMAIKGSDRLTRALGKPRAQDVDQLGRTITNGVQLWPVGVSVLKDEIYSWLLKPLPEEDEETPRGWCYFPEYGQDYFKGLCAEERKLVGEKMKWIKVYERNEPLDLRVYARAASIALEIDRWDESRWEQEENEIEDSKKSRPKPQRDRRRRQRADDDWLGVNDIEW